MKKLFIFLLFLLLTLPALAEGPVEMADPLTGVYTWPEGSNETEARYIYRYSYPQLAGDSELALHFNTTYAYAVDDALGFEVPMLASSLLPDDPQKVVDISFDVTCTTAEYLSVRITKRVTVAGDTTQVVSGHVFALTGPGAGRITNLPVYMGLLAVEETDEWLLTRQTNKADKLVRTLIWAEIASAGADGIYYDDLTFEEVEASFYPEEDFFLTGEGDLCFYFQPGTIAPEEEGLITFTFPLWLLLDEL